MSFAKSMIVSLLVIAALVGSVASFAEEGDIMLDQVSSHFVTVHTRYRESEYRTVVVTVVGTSSSQFERKGEVTTVYYSVLLEDRGFT